jgi:hypothetical protein
MIAFRYTAEGSMSFRHGARRASGFPPSLSSDGYRRPFARVKRSGLEADYLLSSNSGDEKTWSYNSL